MQANSTNDGLFYQVCYRCGINFAVPGWSVAVFCRDCFHPDLIGVFRPVDYSFKKKNEK